MTSSHTTPQAEPFSGRSRLDPAHSSAESHVRHFYGLMTVKGHFTASRAHSTSTASRPLS